MRLHTNKITEADVAAAARAAGMTGVTATAYRQGSRSHAYALEVKLTGTSPRTANTGRYGAAGYGAERAATWDEYGMLMAALYEIDPDAAWGPSGRPAYANRAAFHAATFGRYLGLRASEQHRTHKWQASGDGTQTCKGCDAVTVRRFTYKRPADIAQLLDDERRYTSGTPYFDGAYVAEGVKA